MIKMGELSDRQKQSVTNMIFYESNVMKPFRYLDLYKPDMPPFFLEDDDLALLNAVYGVSGIVGCNRVDYLSDWFGMEMYAMYPFMSKQHQNRELCETVWNVIPAEADFFQVTIPSERTDLINMLYASVPSNWNFQMMEVFINLYRSTENVPYKECQSIRKATVDDIPAIRKLYAECGGFPNRFQKHGIFDIRKVYELYANNYERLIKQGSTVFVYELAREVVGAIATDWDTEVYSKTGLRVGTPSDISIIVSRKYRECGIGKNLLHAHASHFQSQGVEYEMPGISYTNFPSLKFFIGNGFKYRCTDIVFHATRVRRE